MAEPNSPVPSNLGVYDILSKIADGSMGAVYKAKNRNTGQTVAIKMIAPATAINPVLLQRFEREFLAARSLYNLNVVRSIDYSGALPDPYLVMEFVEGLSVGQRIEQRGAYSEDEAVGLVAQVCHGLQSAHERGLVHRDLTPDNILVTREGIAKFADFGAVQEIGSDPNEAPSGRGLGTPHYMAPEKFRNAKSVDVRSDIYSLGITLYVMVTGVNPFDNASPLDCWMKKIRNKFPPPKELNPSLSDRVDLAIRRAMNAEPSQRQSSCLAFLEDLTGQSHPASPEPPSGHTPINRPTPTRNVGGLDGGSVSTIPAALNQLVDLSHGSRHDDSPNGENQRLKAENKELRTLLDEMKHLLQEASNTEQQLSAKEKEFETVVAEKDAQIDELNAHLGAIEEQIAKGELAPPPPVPKTRPELEEWGDELEKESAKLAQDKKRVDDERRQLREDEEALEQQMRQMEVSMARERAMIARQETELKRVNAEILHELEILQRGDPGLREQMAKFQRRAQEVMTKPGRSAPLASRSPVPGSGPAQVARSVPAGDGPVKPVEPSIPPAPTSSTHPPVASADTSTAPSSTSIIAAELRRRLLASTPPPRPAASTPDPEVVEEVPSAEVAPAVIGTGTRDLLARLRMPGDSGVIPLPVRRPNARSTETPADPVGLPDTIAVSPCPPPDQVHFSLTAPAAMRPGQRYALNVWAHLASQRVEVLSRAREAQPLDDVQIQSKGEVPVARGTNLTVQLRIPAFQPAAPDDTDLIVWNGEIGNATFPVRVPPDTSPGSYDGTVLFYAVGLQIAKLHFVLRVALADAPSGPLEVREVRHKRAFASYASQDRDAVLGRIQGIQKVLPELEIFLDVVSLRSGEKWADRLEREVASRDVFYLFWSASASTSEWVEREWRAALKARGIDYIDPVPLVDPKTVPPPPELASSLHFNDWVLAYMRGAGARSPEPLALPEGRGTRGALVVVLICVVVLLVGVSVLFALLR